MSGLGNMTQSGFRPGEDMFSLEDLLKRVSPNGGAQPVEKSESAKKSDELLGKYVGFYKAPYGHAVWDDLLDLTFRSTLSPPEGFETIEAYTIAALKHQARCDLVATMAAKIAKGLALAEAQAKAKKDTKSKKV